MTIEKFEFIMYKNLHFETEKILVLGYDSHEQSLNARWKPNLEEWRLQTKITFLDGSVVLVYDKRELGI